MKATYVKAGDKFLALNFKAASSSLIRSISTEFYPELEDTLQNNTSYPEGVTSAGMRLHAFLDKTETPEGTTVLVVRDPVERFRSACAETGKTAEEGLSEGQKNNYFWPTSRLLKGTVQLYRFESDLEAAATALGLPYPLPEIPTLSTGVNPTLTADQLARVQALYADDIALFESITAAGQVWIAPPVPATDEMKAEKITEFQRLAKTESDSDITIEGIGIFHVDAKTILQLTTIEALIADGTHPALVGGEYPDYKCVDGSFVNLSATVMATIRTAIMARDLNAYSVKLKGLVDAIAAATNVEELTSINW